MLEKQARKRQKKDYQRDSLHNNLSPIIRFSADYVVARWRESAELLRFYRSDVLFLLYFDFHGYFSAKQED